MILQKIRLAEMNALEVRKTNEKLVSNQKIYVSEFFIFILYFLD